MRAQTRADVRLASMAYAVGTVSIVRARTGRRRVGSFIADKITMNPYQFNDWEGRVTQSLATVPVNSLSTDLSHGLSVLDWQTGINDCSARHKSRRGKQHTGSYME